MSSLVQSIGAWFDQTNASMSQNETDEAVAAGDMTGEAVSAAGDVASSAASAVASAASSSLDWLKNLGSQLMWFLALIIIALIAGMLLLHKVGI